MKIICTIAVLIISVSSRAVATIQLTPSSNAPVVTEEVSVAWQAPSGEAGPDDWIGLYRVGGKDDIFHPSIHWQGTNGLSSGEMNFIMPQNPGSYEFRYFSGNAYDVVAKSIPMDVHRESIASCLPPDTTRSYIKHVVVIIQENHSFDSYFGSYCKAPPGSEPTCNEGGDCCEAAPLKDPGTGVSQRALTDLENFFYDPNHNRECELEEINGGKMDRFVAGTSCSNPRNFAVVDNKVIETYFNYAKEYAMADRYFQPVAGASSSNDMYLARASYVFSDDTRAPDSVGTACFSQDQKSIYKDPTVGDLLASCNVPWSFFAEGYKLVLSEPFHLGIICEGVVYDPTDNPFQYYANFRDNLTYMKDYHDFTRAISRKRLPAVSYIKPIELNNEHPGGSFISVGVSFTKNIVDQVLNSPEYKDNTLIIVTADESGGYFDHVAPPPTSVADGQPYGPRTFLLAVGNFAKKNYVSHVVMEHSSIVKFIEWNFLSGQPGQLRTRDAVVNNIGDLLDPDKTGVAVPSN